MPLWRLADLEATAAAREEFRGGATGRPTSNADARLAVGVGAREMPTAWLVVPDTEGEGGRE